MEVGNMIRMRDITGTKNPRWNSGFFKYKDHAEMKRNRKKILEKANYTCSYCPARATIVHHIDGSKDNHSESNLLAVCRRCHKKIHVIKGDYMGGRIPNYLKVKQ